MKKTDEIVNDPRSSKVSRDFFALLIEGHSALSRRIEIDEGKAHLEKRDQFSTLLDYFKWAHERDRLEQESSAEDFNLLETLQVAHKEIRHSMVLAWLLDHDTDRQGTHAQGALGFRLLLAELGLPSHYADHGYHVNREVAGDESIVDLELAARGKFLIHIENKISSSEGLEQTNREWADLLRRATVLGIGLGQSSPPIHAFFLTPSGKPPQNRNFKPISWKRIANVFGAFSARAKPPDVKLFADHYAKTITRFVIQQSQQFGE